MSANINGATMVASDSMVNLGVSILSFSQVIFSLGTAPEQEPSSCGLKPSAEQYKLENGFPYAFPKAGQA